MITEGQFESYTKSVKSKKATTYASGNQNYRSVRKYADTHLHEEFKCFNY